MLSQFSAREEESEEEETEEEEKRSTCSPAGSDPAVLQVCG